MIGLKTVAVAAVSAAIVAIAATRGLLDAGYLATLSATSCLVAGMFGGLATALLAAGWRPARRSRIAVDFIKMRLELAPERPRELPPSVQHLLLIAAFTCMGLGAFTNQATARLETLPEDLARPSPSEFCPPAKPVESPPPSEPAAEVPGCALVRRAYELGYAESLGSCAPKIATAPAPAPIAPARCTLRQADEPALHYAWRRMVDRLENLTGFDPSEAVSSGAHAFRIKLDHVDTLVAHQGHAVASTRHASHHLWVNLPAPRDPSWTRWIAGAPRCSEHYDRLPLWRSFAGERAPSELFDQVVGQLLFAPGFGVVPARCDDYTIHWDAPPDSCARLIADPAGFLARSGALEQVRDVLDRRRRQLEIGELDTALGRRPTVEAPPPADALVSLHCFAIGSAGGVRGASIELDGETLPVRELRAPAISARGAGPIELAQQLATLLAGVRATPAPASAPTPDVIAADFLLTRLEHLRDSGPFGGATWPLDDPELVEVYPFHLHLHAFVDDFRRGYWAQRGRL